MNIGAMNEEHRNILQNASDILERARNGKMNMLYVSERYASLR